LKLGDRFELGHYAVKHRLQAQFKNHRGRGQLVRLAPLGVQLADMADYLATRQHLRAAARVHMELVLEVVRFYRKWDK
jgi:hypothetical protein